jgi:uncharacterized protein YndB with AHSA1/START domain
MSNPEFKISRTFDAPLSLVWEVYSQEKHLRNWWGPKGFEWVSGTLDFRPGGVFHYGMRPPNGHIMWGKFNYREIVPMKKIVFTNSFSDEAGMVTRAPFAANFPLEVFNTILFSERDGKTTLDMTGTPFNASDDENAFFESMFPSMNQGFNGTFVQLEAYLAEVQG